ncbi:hypothetical protein ABGB18_14815 [Nonomuraea sp. B12E4]|uniref:hypothetical protein n=1 Tax=Nonomuraea sp. B12E4 TaxID=3153564 RepID=UPI00325E229E
MTKAPPVPPASYWPDQGVERPSTSKPPGWAKGVMAAAAAIALLGGALIAVRDAGAQPSVALPPAEPGKVDLPASPPTEAPSPASSFDPFDPSPGPSEQDTAAASASPTVTSAFSPLQDVPEVCDLLPESLTAKLAPMSESAPGVAKDGYGAKRKDCMWMQKGFHMKNGYTLARSITVKVNVFPDLERARGDADSTWRLMRDMSGETSSVQEYGEMKDVSGLGDEAHAVYFEGTLRHNSVAWIFLLRGNATIEIRYNGADNKGRDLFGNKDSRPIPEEELLKGAEEIAGEVVKGLTG